MKKVSRFTTAMGVFTLGLGLAGASIAVADPGTAPDAPTPPVAVNPDTKISMTIVKYDGPEVAKGSQPTDANKPVEGIKFTVTPINPQGVTPAMGTAAWWDWAYQQKTNELKQAAKGEAITLTTDANGQACLSNETGKTTAESATPKVVAGTACTVKAELKQGLYLVEETGTTAKNGKTYRGALPFFITLPLAEGDDTKTATWNYNPVIQPKNQEFSSEKKLTDASADGVTYTIDTSIPTTNMKAEGNKIYDEKLPFGIEDLIPAGLTAKTGEVKVFAKGTAGTKTELTVDTDYKVVEIQAGATDAGSGVWNKAVNGAHSVGIYFTTAGAAKLAEIVKGDASAKVYFQLPFTVTDASAKIVNKYVTHDPGSDKKPNTPPDPNPDPTPGTNDDLQFINVKITKTDAQNGDTKLEGAVFNFYKCTKDEQGNLTPKGKAVPGWTQDGVFNSDTNKSYDFTTAASTGEVTAFHVLNTAKVTQTDTDGVPTTDKYVMCAVEKTAPTGYKVNPYPIEITDAGSTAQGADKPVTIPNTKATFWDNLPKTGAAGVTVLLLVGGGLVIVGVLMRRRREEA